MKSLLSDRVRRSIPYVAVAKEFPNIRAKDSSYSENTADVDWLR